MIIPGFTRYDITEYGVVTDLVKNRVITQGTVRVGNSFYKRVSLKNDLGHNKLCNVMSLLALTFIGEAPRNYTVFAIDGDNLNTVATNVAYKPRSSIAKELWDSGKMANRASRQRCYNDFSKEMLYEALLAYDEPVTMSELCSVLQVTYSTIRYSMLELVESKKVRKTTKGFEVIP